MLEHIVAIKELDVAPSRGCKAGISGSVAAVVCRQRYDSDLTSKFPEQ